ALREMPALDAENLFDYPREPVETVDKRRSGRGRPLTTVSVFEPDHVVDLGRRDLEKIGVLHGDEAVPASGPHPRAHTRKQSVRAYLAGVVFEHEVEGATLREDRLVLLHVVLEAQRVSGVDMDQLARVSIGDRPSQLVPPGLVDATRAGIEHGVGPRGIAHDAAAAGSRESTPSRRSSSPMSCSTRCCVVASL